MMKKLHYKMYKSGKQWCYAALATATVVVGLGVANTTVLADNNNSEVAVTATQSSQLNNNEQATSDDATTQKNITTDTVTTSTTQSEAAKTNNYKDVSNTPSGDANSTPKDNDQPTQKLNGVQPENGNYYYYKDNVKQTNYYYTDPQSNNTYYFGSDGARWDNRFMVNWGNAYYFTNDGSLMKNQTRNINGTRYTANNEGIIALRNQFLNANENQLYYFDNNGKLATNKFYKNWGHTYYFGPDGARWDNRFYINWGNTYYFGSDGARWDNRFMVKWGNAYYFTNDGSLMKNQTRNINGTRYTANNEGIISLRNQFLNANENQLYYFDNNGNLVTDKFYRNWGNTYYFGPDGARYTNQFLTKNGKVYYFDNLGIMYRNRYYKNWGHTYYFGADGARYTDQFLTKDGKVYYFDGQGIMYQDQYYKNWGHTYYFGPDGARYTDQFLAKDGNVYYFDNDGIMYRNRYYKNWGHTYYFGNNGARYTNQFLSNDDKIYYFDKDGVQLNNQFKTIDGYIYYFGNDGAALTGDQTIDGKKYSFNDQGQLSSGVYGRVENGKLNIYSAKTNTLMKSLDSGDWENIAYSLDSSSINSTDGYLNYTGWYRPYGTSQDGKTWYKTSAADWRPILMYTWPDKDVEAKYIKYFVNNGYTNSDYGLTKDTVANLSKDTDKVVLDKYARDLRFVIEQSIAAHKSTGQLASDINGFMATIPSLSAKSELPIEYSKGYVPDISGSIDDNQLIFVNNNSTNQSQGNTSYADSKYRLMNRTINNQTNTNNSDQSPELLVGNDIDNSNPVVQAENLNWEYFLLNYGKLMHYNSDGNFDGFRIDAADNIDADVLDQVGQLIDDLYNTKGNQKNANDHLLYNEGYHSGAASMLDNKKNPELFMDAGYFFTLENVLGQNADKRDNIANLITNSVVNRANDSAENQATPNWSFVTNHDQRKNVINKIIIDNHPGVPDIMSGSYKDEYAQQAWKTFYADQAKTDKKYAQYNLPAQYAILLSNKDTVPQIYYGDLYKETDQYMQTKSMYYDVITTLMKARGEFVSGGQEMNRVNDHLLISVRYGKGVVNSSDKGNDSLSRTTGMAVVVGNDPSMTEQTISINMGIAHANEQYRNLIDSTANGLTYNGTDSSNPDILTTDSQGILRVKVKGYNNPFVSGYLSVWVPAINGTQDARTSAQDVQNVFNKTFVSNAALDSHMIYEDFSLFQPEPVSVATHAYNVIKNNASLFNQWGVTDFWMAPAYTPFNMSRYHEGYAMTDRYDLGTASNPTKYGDGQELSDAIAALHSAGLKVQEDLVLNQMIGFTNQEAVTVTRADRNAKQLTVDGQTFADQIYFAYTRGGGQGQNKFGGIYLDQLQKDHPDLFTTKAASTGVAPDPNTHIKEWSAKYENGTSLQNIGIGLAVKMPNGYYAYLKDGNNKAFETTLPASISSADYYAEEVIKNNK